jgi:hypothetical protein
MFLLWDVGKGTVEGEDEATLNFVGSRPTAVQGWMWSYSCPAGPGVQDEATAAGKDRQG